MADSKELMKDAFSQFVDTLMDKEVASVRADISNKSADLKTEIDDLTESVAKELEGIREDTSDSINQIERSMQEMNDAFAKSFNDLNNTVNERVETMDKTLRTVITDFSNQIFDRMNQQFSDLNKDMENLAERVHHNEDILHNTRDNHGKISMLLNNFASSISSVSPEVVPAAPSPAVKEEAAKKDEPLDEIKPKTEKVEVVSAPDDKVEEQNSVEKTKHEIPATIDETTGQYIYKPELEGHDEEFDGFKNVNSSEDDDNEVVLDIGELDAK